MTIPYQISQKHNGQVVTIVVPDLAIPKCSHCGELTFDYEADEQLRRALAAVVEQDKPSQNVVLGGSAVQQPLESPDPTRSNS